MQRAGLIVGGLTNRERESGIHVVVTKPCRLTESLLPGVVAYTTRFEESHLFDWAVCKETTAGIKFNTHEGRGGRENRKIGIKNWQ